MSFSLTKSWWKSATVYQIYPISFFDSNGDGIGDLKGIESKLDYLKDLGVDVIWLSPIYPSPLADMGYDISDYCNIDPRYGTLNDFDQLVKGSHERKLKIVMDLVANHTSDEHEWFIQSKSSKSNPKRDWYIWKPPRFDAAGNRKPPNNWKSHFEGSVWTYDESTEEYYLHLYHAKQPDLNWENDDVRQSIYDIMKFWLARGVDGFRMDVINKISKTPDLPDAPIADPEEEYQWGHQYYANGSVKRLAQFHDIDKGKFSPKVHDFLREMHQEVLAHHDLITVGETPSTHSLEQIAAYVLPQNKELNMAFHFEIVDLDSPGGSAKGGSPLIYVRYLLSDLKAIINKWQTYKREEGFWNTVFIENHDQGRSVTRFGNHSDEWRALSAKLLAILQVTQTGTLFVYQGEELGLKNFPKTWGIEEYKDIGSINFYNKIQEERTRKLPGGKGEVDMSDIMENLAMKARDHGRVPMQWNDSPHGGFTTGTPWMRVNEDYTTWNASAEEKDDQSVLKFWRAALRVRKAHDVLIYGDFEDLLPKDEKLFLYKRTLDKESALILLNMSNEDVEFTLPVDVSGFRLVLGNYPEVELKKQGGLRAWEGCVLVK